MSLDSGKVIIPGNGNVLKAEVDTLPFNPAQFVIGNPATYGEGWTSFGHTSRENPPEFEKDGGDPSQKGSWEQDAIDVVYEPVSWSGVINALEMSKETYETVLPEGEWSEDLGGYYDVYGDGKAELALFFIFVQGTKRSGLWFPRVSLGLGDPPSVDVEEFFETQASFQALSSQTLTTAGGRAVKHRWFPVRQYSATASPAPLAPVDPDPAA